MIFSKGVLWLLCMLLLLSVFIANMLNHIATDHNFFVEDKESEEKFTKRLGAKYKKITDTTNNLIWFMQISDIHISIFKDPGRISQFQQFCDSTVKNIKPLVVLATGDLTDAKAKNVLGSSQIKTEWVYYFNIIKESGVTDDTVWLDIRGNHDNFNIRTINSPENYFRNYSVQGSANPKSYAHFENKNGVNVAFVGVDACPDPGLKRPFNFIGILDVQEQQRIERLSAEAAANADHIVWFGHYPTSCMLSIKKDSQKLDLKQLIGSSPQSQVYVCGHLHSMGGFVPNMYTRQQKGYLELELEDWKSNRMYRLAAIDHGHFSFVDQKHNNWPLVLVTNPKNALYLMPGREPLHLIPESTHIRILAFSDVDIRDVEISFDNISWMSCTPKGRPLYTCHWLPHLFKNGVHHLFVRVSDEHDKEVIIDHEFSFHARPYGFNLTARILLMLDAGNMFQLIFATLLVMHVIPLIILRFENNPPRYRRRLGRHILRRIWLLSKMDRIFYPLVLFALYIPIGPWAIGYLIDDHIGVIFAWGIFIKGSMLPEPFTYMYGSMQLLFVQIPLVCVLAHSLDNRLFGLPLRGIRRIVNHLPFIFLMSIQFLLVYFFWLEYGTMTLLIGPLRTWSIALSLTLWYMTINLPQDYLGNLAKLNEIAS